MARRGYDNNYNDDLSSYGRSSSSGRSTGRSQSDFRAVAPPSSLAPARGYTKQTQIHQTVQQMPNYDQILKKPRTEEDYWNDDEEEAPKSKPEEDDDEEDPLDAFMADLSQTIKKESRKPKTKSEQEKLKKGIRDDIEDEDDEESYYRYMKENPLAGLNADDEDADIEYDEDGNPIAPPRSKWIDPLPAIDHSEIEYKPFEKNFYNEHADISSLSVAESNNLRQTLGIRVVGAMAVHPVVSFAHMNLDGGLMKAIRKALYEQPTPIQAQAIPLALQGRDLIGIAKTGSGKTLAFIIPLLVHLMDQPELEEGDGPVGLILAPTRELAMQIYTEAKKFAKVYNVNVACCFGGGSKWEQSKTLAEGAEIVVATPGRMIDMIKMKATNLRRVSFLVLDEADRMFDMGFEPQVRSICDHVRPDRQCLMFSATFKKRIERLARDVLTDPIKIIQGDIGEATQDVTQLMVFMAGKEQKDVENAKFQWLADNLVGFCSQGTVLVFITKKANCEIVAQKLRQRDHQLGLLHGDIEQTERTKIIAAFKRQEFPILVATDVCARGLDISHIRTVVNFDMARDIDTHTHRVGRTGRAGQKGMAYSLVCERDKEFAGHLVRNLEGANQKVPSQLMELAMQSQWFRKSRFKQGRGKQLEFRNRERPGLGCKEPGSSIQGSASISFTAADNPGGSSEPTSRLNIIKATYGAQYRSSFRAASDSSSSQPTLNQRPPPSDQQKAKKSRWA